MVRGRPKTHVPALMEPKTWNRETDKTGLYFEVYTQTHTQVYNEKKWHESNEQNAVIRHA